MTSVRGSLSSDIAAFMSKASNCQEADSTDLKREVVRLEERIQIERGISSEDLATYNLVRQVFDLQPLAVHVTSHYVFSNPRAAYLFQEIQSVDQKISKSPISYSEKRAAEKAYESLRLTYASLLTITPREELDVLYKEMTHVCVKIRAILTQTNAREFYLENSSTSTATLVAGVVGAVAGYFQGWVWGVAASALTLMIDKRIRNSYSAPNFLSVQLPPGLTTYHLYGSFNQDTAYRVPSSQIAQGQGRNSCCVNAPYALRAMLQNKLTTQAEMDGVLKVSIPAYNRVVGGYCRDTGENVPSPLLGWDCVPGYDPIGTDLETLSTIMNPKRLDLQPGQERNQYRELLREMEKPEYARDLREGESIGGILTATLKTFAVKMTRHTNGFFYDFYDSHGRKPPRMEAYMVGFSSLDPLVNFLAENNPAVNAGSADTLRAQGYSNDVIALLFSQPQDEVRRANNAGIHIVRLRKGPSPH